MQYLNNGDSDNKLTTLLFIWTITTVISAIATFPFTETLSISTSELVVCTISCIIIQITSIQRQNIEPVYLRKGKRTNKTWNNPNNLDILLSSEVKNCKTVIFISEVMPLSENSPLLNMFEPISRQTSNFQALSTTISRDKF